MAHSPPPTKPAAKAPAAPRYGSGSVECQDQREREQIAELLGGLAIDPHEGQCEQTEYAERQRDRQAEAAGEADAGGDQRAERGEAQQDGQAAADRAAGIAQAGPQGGERGFPQRGPAERLVDGDDDGDGQRRAHALARLMARRFSPIGRRARSGARSRARSFVRLWVRVGDASITGQYSWSWRVHPHPCHGPRRRPVMAFSAPTKFVGRGLSDATLPLAQNTGRTIRPPGRRSPITLDRRPPGHR